MDATSLESHPLVSCDELMALGITWNSLYKNRKQSRAASTPPWARAASTEFPNFCREWAGQHLCEAGADRLAWGLAYFPSMTQLMGVWTVTHTALLSTAPRSPSQGPGCAWRAQAGWAGK